MLEECKDIKYETGSSTAPPWLPSRNRILLHYSAADGPILTKLGNLIQNSKQITAIWSKSPRKEFQYGGLLFLQTGSSYLSRGLRYLDEIWFADRFWPSDESDIIKYETGSSIEPPLPVSWNCICRHYSPPRVAPTWTKFGSLMRNSTPMTTIWS